MMMKSIKKWWDSLDGCCHDWEVVEFLSYNSIYCDIMGFDEGLQHSDLPYEIEIKLKKRREGCSKTDYGTDKVCMNCGRSVRGIDTVRAEIEEAIEDVENRKRFARKLFDEKRILDDD